MAADHESQEKNLKVVMGTGDVIALAVGLIIGAGVMSLTGVAIGRTGTGVFIAYIAAAVLTTINSIPTAQLGSAAPCAGAGYKYSSRLIGSAWGFFYIATYIPMYLAFSVYALAFAQFFQFLVPSADQYLVAIIVLTVFYVVNLLGTANFTKVQNVMVIILLAAIAVFVAYGLPEVDYARAFQPQNLAPEGAGGILYATALLAFSMAGAAYMAGMGSEMKNPGRDIPLGIVVGTLGVGVLYALIGIVAAGVLPWQEVANQSLAVTAREILPKPLFYFFLIGGGLGATATTINGTFGYVSKPLISACEDGWLPKRLGRVNPKTGVPVYLLTLFYIVGLLPLVFRVSLSSVSDACAAAGMVGAAITPLALLNLRKKRPDLYEKSAFKIPVHLIRPLAILDVIISLFQGVILITQFPVAVQLIFVAYIAVVVVFGLLYQKRVPITDDLEPARSAVTQEADVPAQEPIAQEG